MCSQHRCKGTYHEPAPIQIAAFHFDTTFTIPPAPNCYGNYEEVGIYNGRPYYKRFDSAFFIWYEDLNNWILSVTLGDKLHGYWIRNFITIPGVFTPILPFEGAPIAEEGPM
jgi:hypothetical protein